MFDNLRDQANASQFEENEAQFQSVDDSVPGSPFSSERFLGMTSVQRFIISVIIMIMVCSVGAMFLLVTGKFGLF